MITGDARQVAEAVGGQLGIDEVFAEVLSQDKDAKVAELQARAHRAAMVGDGVNDAPALARADVGVAIGAGTDVAIESAGVVLVGDDPRAVLSVIELSRASYRKMWQNLAWATGVQPGRGPARCRGASLRRRRASPGRGRGADVGVDRRRGAQCPAPAPPEPRPGPTRRPLSSSGPSDRHTRTGLRPDEPPRNSPAHSLSHPVKGH